MNEDSVNVQICFTTLNHTTSHVNDYRPEHDLVRVVFDYTIARRGRTITQIADQAYRIGNGVAVDDAEHQLRCAYEAALLRPVAVGDVVTVGQIVLAVGPAGFERIPVPAFTEVNRRERATILVSQGGRP